MLKYCVFHSLCISMHCLFIGADVRQACFPGMSQITSKAILSIGPPWYLIKEFVMSGLNW